MKLIIVYTLLISLCCCEANIRKESAIKQENQTIKQDTTMERFDKIKFDANKVDGEYNFTLQNGLQVRQLKFGEDSYVEYSKYAGATKEMLKEYFASTLFLKTKGETFYGSRIGTWQEYDESGKLLKETDYDKPYKYSIAELNEDMKKMGLEIMKQHDDVTVSRNDEPEPQYIVSYPVTERPYELNILLIDGNTGKIIKKSIGHIKN
jgi:hypothetical protein